jgi:hypothetical protein
MGLRSLLRNFSSTNLELDPYDRNPEINEDVAQSIVYLLARHSASEVWKMLTCDTDGRLLVSTSATQTDSGVNSAPSVDNTADVILASNPNRRQYAIYNNGTVIVYLGFGNTPTTALGFPLPVGAVWTDDVFTGEIMGITAAVACELRVVEF